MGRGWAGFPSAKYRIEPHDRSVGHAGGSILAPFGRAVGEDACDTGREAEHAEVGLSPRTPGAAAVDRCTDSTELVVLLSYSRTRPFDVALCVAERQLFGSVPAAADGVQVGELGARAAHTGRLPHRPPAVRQEISAREIPSGSKEVSVTGFGSPLSGWKSIPRSDTPRTIPPGGCRWLSRRCPANRTSWSSRTWARGVRWTRIPVAHAP